ncbi:MAG: SIMPL domain-containing protein [Pseudonocardiaceae bacterium]
MAEVVTRGSGEHEQIADRAELQVTFAASGVNRTAAVAELGSRVLPMEPVFGTEGVELRSRRMAVHSTWEGKRCTGCRAQLSVTLRVHRLGALEGLLDAVVTAEPESVHGPSWQLADDTGAVAVAQRHAVADARRRAEGYAAALGARLGPLQSISDTGAERPMARMAVEHAGHDSTPSGPPSVADLGLEPTPVTVTATCTTVWTLHD